MEKCPFCNSDAWIQTGVNYNITADGNIIRIKCTNVNCQAIIETKCDSKLLGLAYMSLLQKSKSLEKIQL